MSDNENDEGAVLDEPADDEEAMEDDEGEIFVELMGNFLDGFEVANAFRVDEDDSDDEEEEEGEEDASAGAVGGQRSDGAGSEETGTTGAVQPPSGQSYDKCLPSKHLYLGQNVEEVRGHQTMPDDFEEIEIPLFPERKFALVPGQVSAAFSSNEMCSSTFFGFADQPVRVLIRFETVNGVGIVSKFTCQLSKT